MIMDAKRERRRIEWRGVLGKARLSAAGMMSEEEATTIREAMVAAAVALKVQSWDQPPMKRQVPRHFLCQ